MDKKIELKNDHYIIDKDYKLLSFNQSVADRYTGIKVGDLCYKATMNRDTPCLHCPIAGNSDCDSPIYFDPFYNDWTEAIFSETADGNYSVICRPANKDSFDFIGEKHRSELLGDISGEAVNERLVAKVREQLEIIEGFNRLFFSVCVIDLTNRTFRLASTRDNISKAIGMKGNADSALEYMCNEYVLPEFREAVKAFSCLDDIDERVGDKSSVTIDYKGVMEGWSRGIIIPISRDENGKITKLIYALMAIRGDKEKELLQQAALEEQMAVITGLAAEYFSVMLVDYQNDTVRVYRENGDEGRRIGSFISGYKSWSKAVRAYADRFVPKEEREVFCKALSNEYIAENTEEYSFNYTLTSENGVSHLQFKVAYAKDKKGCQFAVVGTKNVDKEFHDREQLRKAQQEIARSYSMISGLSQEYHTVWLITAADRVMHLFRSNGGSSLSEFVSKNFNGHEYTSAIDLYINTYVDENDRERVRAASAYDSLLENIGDKGIYIINYLRHDDKGNENYHQMAFAKAEEENSDAVNIVLAFRNVDSMVKEEQEKQRVLRDALAAAEHANRAKTTFLNNMSHDIRTPMNAIIGFTSLAAAHIDNTEQVQGYLEKIQISSRHLLSLINDVLDMSRIESGKVRIEEKETHLPEVMHDLRTIVQSDITSKQLDFYIDTVDVINEDVICDKLRLNQVLMNILSNAMKFTKPGGIVSLRLMQKPCAQKGFARYEFHIKDNGIGMSPEFISHVFEPFEREASSTVSGIQGTGLGMAITKNIVDMMGGTILVESESGKGTEFTVVLQLKISGEAVKHEAIPELQGLRVLVADDDAETCMSICKMLGTVGMRSEWTSYGKEAVIRTRFAIEQDDEFNAYIIDWLMPDMNGIEVVRRIRRIIGESKPIIILTAYDWADIEEEAREAGVTAFCSKPLFMSELRDILSQPYITECGKEASAEENTVDFTGKKILLVEDNELNQEIAAEILREAGFLLDIAGDGDAAVDIMAKSVPGQYDLILMDIQMPIMDGYEATRRIRQLPNKYAAEIPIFAMTANAFAEDKENAREAGMNGHISKPIEVSKLMDALTQVFIGIDAKKAAEKRKGSSAKTPKSKK